MKMNKTKTILSAAALLAAFSTSSMSQVARNDGTTQVQTAPAPTPEGKKGHSIEKRIEKMKEKLNLSNAQVAQIKTILEQSKSQFKADREKWKSATEAEKEAMKEQMKQNREARKEKLMAILTPEQRAKAGKFFDHGKGHKEGKGKGKKG